MALRTFSFGGGVQSTACLILAAKGKIDYPVFLFSNVGEDSENPETLFHVENYHKPFAKDNGIEFYELERIPVKGRFKGQRMTIYQYCMSDEFSIIIPVYMNNGAPGQRTCTRDYKAHLIDKWQRKNGAKKDDPAVTGLGISIDEIERMQKSSRIQTQVFEYPLIDLRLDREDCKKIIEEEGLPVPPKSSCWFCPFQRHERWIELRDKNPELFGKAIELEKHINTKRLNTGRDEIYLHHKLIPLSEINDEVEVGIEDSPCDNGYCFT